MMPPSICYVTTHSHASQFMLPFFSILHISLQSLSHGPLNLNALNFNFKCLYLVIISCDVSQSAYPTELLCPLQITSVDFRDCENLSYGCGEIRYKKARIHPKLSFLKAKKAM